MKKRIFLAVLVFLWLLPSCSVVFNVIKAGLIVRQRTQIIKNKTGKFDFGGVNAGSSSAAVVFTIENQGLETVHLTTNPIVMLSGTNAADFQADSSSTNAVILPSASTTFTIIFSPSSAGKKSAIVSIANDTKKQNPYKFTVSGTGIAVVNAPEINIKQGNDNIPCTSGTYDFGSVSVGWTSPAIAFTIENLGNQDLNLTGAPFKIAKSGVDEGMFTIDQTMTNSPVTAGFSTQFTVSFKPTSQGAKSATIMIPNNDSDENPYSFTVTGNGAAPVNAPEINVKQGTTNIACTTGSFDFGEIRVNESSSSTNFTIENLGNADLFLTGNPIIQKSGTDASMFTINLSATTSPILPAGSTTFTITFTPTSVGAKSATISIANNDSDENPYTFTILGTGTTPEINVKQGSDNIPCTTGIYNFRNVGMSSSSPEITFTIENLGTSPLILTGNPKIQISGVYSALFTINESAINSPIYPSSYTTFAIAFTPTTLGVKTATVSIPNNDNNKNPYVFTITGIGHNYVSAVGWIGGGSNDWKTTTAPTTFATDYQSFNYPYGIFADYSGFIYIADESNSRICKWYCSGNAIGWIGGGSNGWKTTDSVSSGNSYQSFRRPRSSFVDSFGSICVADFLNHRICKWDSAGNAIGWIGGGSNGWKTGTAPSTYASDYQSFYKPSGVFVDSSGYIYIAEEYNYRISKWDSSGNAIGWIGGGSNGWKTTNSVSSGNSYQSFNRPLGVFVDNNGYIYVADFLNHRICKWSSSGNAIGWIGGGSNGWKTSNGATLGNSYMAFNNPSGVYVDTDGYIFIADRSCNRISKWDYDGYAIGWIGGNNNGWQTTNGASRGNTYQSFNYPTNVFCDTNGCIYVADMNNHRVCKWQE